LCSSFKYLRRLSLSKMTISFIEPDMFMNFTIDLEELQITGSDIKTVKAHAFKHIHGLKYLDLSDNVISTLDSDAFKEVIRKYSFIKLKLFVVNFFFQFRLAILCNSLKCHTLLHLRSNQYREMLFGI